MKVNLSVKKKRFFKRALRVFFFLFLFAFASLLGLQIWCQVDYDKIVRKAQQKFQGNKVESLLAALESDSYSLAEKNRVIGALGILKDQRALPKMEALRTFRPCDGISVCQYELNKAILKIKGEYKHEYFSSWVRR